MDRDSTAARIAVLLVLHQTPNDQGFARKRTCITYEADRERQGIPKQRVTSRFWKREASCTTTGSPFKKADWERMSRAIGRQIGEVVAEAIRMRPCSS